MMILSLILVLCLFVGCSDSKTDELIGTWKYTFDEGYATLTFDETGKCTTFTHWEGYEDITEIGSYYINGKDYIKMIYRNSDSYEGYKVYVMRKGAGTQEPTYSYTFKAIKGDEHPAPQDFTNEYFSCSDGELKSLIDAALADEEKFPIVVSFRQSENDEGQYDRFGSMTFYKDTVIDYEIEDLYDKDLLLYGFKYLSEGSIKWNENSFDWGADDISTTYLFSIEAPEDVSETETYRFEINGDELAIWWAPYYSPYVFTKQ